jgi:nuclear pore complex protein Nup160
VAATTALARALERQAGALMAALNALRLCAPGERGVWDDDRDGGDTESQSHDETVGAVARAAILASARLELLVAGAEPAETRLGEHLGEHLETEDAYAIVPSLVASLVSHARFASAETLACAWTEGEALTDLVCLIAAALAARAALAQQADRRLAVADADSNHFDSSFDSSPFVALESLGALGRSCASPDARACGGGILGASLGGERREEEADAAQAWAATRAFLERHDVARRNFRPAEAAARAVLATGTQIRLPQWLAARFVRGRNPAFGSGAAKGMAARDANPAALLRVYLAHNRLEEAARLAVAEVAAARRAPATERTRSCASWFPEPLLRHTRERVREVRALESLGEELERLLEQRSRTAEADSAKLAAAA